MRTAVIVLGACLGIGADSLHAQSQEYYHSLSYGPLRCQHRDEVIVCDYDNSHYGQEADLIYWRSTGGPTLAVFGPLGLEGQTLQSTASIYAGYPDVSDGVGYASAKAPGVYACYTTNNVYAQWPGDGRLRQADCRQLVYYISDYGVAGTGAGFDEWRSTPEIRCEISIRDGHPLYCVKGGVRSASVAVTSVSVRTRDGACGSSVVTASGTYALPAATATSCSAAPGAVALVTRATLGDADALIFTCRDASGGAVECDRVIELRHNRSTVEPLQTCVAPPNGLRFWWSGDDWLGDGGPEGRSAVGHGASYTDGKVGRAFYFPNPNAWLEGPGLFGDTPEITISAWVKPEAAEGGFSAIVSSYQQAFAHLQLAEAGNIVLYTDNGVAWLPNVPRAPLGQWRHIALTATSQTIRLWVDGTIVGTSALSFSRVSGSPGIGIARGYEGGRPFVGAIDEVQIYYRALEADEVRALNAAGSFGVCK